MRLRVFFDVLPRRRMPGLGTAGRRSTCFAALLLLASCGQPADPGINNPLTGTVDTVADSVASDSASDAPPVDTGAAATEVTVGPPDATTPETVDTVCVTGKDCIGKISQALIGPCGKLACIDATCAVLPDKEGAACDDGNACTITQVCTAGKCAGGQALPCVDDKPCTADGCYALSGCVFLPADATCTDGNACTLGDACLAGACLPGTAVVCNDNNPCTADTCDAKLGCVSSAALAACSDGNACTSGDSCKGVTCVGIPMVCDDNNPCTDDACDTAMGCKTGDNTGLCSDGVPCTKGDHCNAGQCVGTQLNCDDANACTSESCNAATGQCSYAMIPGCAAPAVPCNAANPCKAGVCDPASLACVACLAKSDCSKPGQTCVALACVPFVACKSDVDCKGTGQVCDKAGGACVDCLGAIDCGPAKACIAHQCVAAPACGSSKECAKVCNPQSGTCVDCLSADDCLNSQFCNSNHQCAPDVCVAGSCGSAQNYFACAADGSGFITSTSCDDGNGCTDDTCVPAKGCVVSANSAPCNDGKPCSGGDQCSGGKCVGKPIAGCCVVPSDCDDGDTCTIDACASGQCSHQTTCCATDKDCSDGETKCTTDTCVAKSCVHSETGAPGCCTPEVYLNNFDDGDLKGITMVNSFGPSKGWQLWSSASISHSSPGVLYYGSPAQGNYDFGGASTGTATTAKIALPTTIASSLSFWLNMDTEGSAGYDTLVVSTLIAGQKTQIFSKTTPGFNIGTWFHVKADLSAGKGKDLQVVFDFNTVDTVANSTKGVFIDDFQVLALCKDANATCTLDATCDDGNACTTDACTSGKCAHSNLMGACSDGNACTSGDSCNAGVCSSTKTTVCDDGLVCTADSCNAATGNCVFTSTGLPGCCTPSLYENDFESSDLKGATINNSGILPVGKGWQILQKGKFTKSGTGALYFGDPATWTYVGGKQQSEVVLPSVTIPKSDGVQLTGWLYIDIADGCDHGFNVLPEPGNGYLYGQGSPGYAVGKWVPLAIDLAAYKGQNVKLHLKFYNAPCSSPVGSGVYLDDIKVSAPCP